MVFAGGANREAMSYLANLPVRFEPVGADHQRFVARGVHYRASLTANESRVIAGGKAVSLKFEGARNVALEGASPLRAVTNVMRGNDRSKWRTGIPNYGRVMARGLYPGIDIIYYGSHGELEYDLVLHPGADLTRVRFRITGAEARLDSEGNLVAGAVHRSPITYQATADGGRTRVASKFRRNSDGSFGFEVASYDRRRELVVDPQIAMADYLSGANQDIAVAVGHDAAGFIYVGGTTYSTDFSITDSAFQSDNKGTSDLFVVQLDPTQPSGAQVVYSTYAGGSSDDVMTAMAVDGAGTVYMTGQTSSDDFPLGNAAQSTISGTSDAFVLWLNPSQSGADGIYYGTYFGGTLLETGNGIALDNQGRIAVVGATNSTDMVASNGWGTGLLGNKDAFVALFDPKQSSSGTLVYSSYLGGTNLDFGGGIAAAADGTLWVTGSTISGDFPLAGNAIQPYYGYGGDAFVAQIDPNQAGSSSLLYGSYLGGSDNEGANAIAVDSTGRVMVTGYTLSADFPVTATAVQKALATADQEFPNANAFVFVMKLSSTAVWSGQQMLYSSYLGGTGGDEGYAIAGDAAGNVYVAGLTKSADFPVTSNALQKALLAGPSGFVTKLNIARSTADYSSLVTSTGNQVVYGLDIDAKGVIWVAGFTSGPLLETLGGPPRTSDAGNSDAFVTGYDIAK